MWERSKFCVVGGEYLPSITVIVRSAGGLRLAKEVGREVHTISNAEEHLEPIGRGKDVNLLISVAPLPAGGGVKAVVAPK